jgi:AdoMet-dependent heme synthase
VPEREPHLEATRRDRPASEHPGAAGYAPHDASRFDFHRDPFIVFYELTRACDLACRHCRASAMRKPQPGQLDAASSRDLVEQLATFDRKPIVVFTGGDPCKREDLVYLVRLANDRGIKPSLAPAATPLLSEAKLAELKAAGLQRVAISLDGPDRESHEALRRVPGSFNDSLGAIERCRDAGLGLQINTTVTRHNIGRLSEMADAVEAAGAGMWSVFFLVPVGRGLREQRISPEQYEEVFAFLHEQAGHRPFAIKTTEAPFYRRFVLQRKGDPQRGPARAPLGINDGKGVMFIAHDEIGRASCRERV